MTRSYQFQLVSLHGLLLLSWGWFAQFEPIKLSSLWLRIRLLAERFDGCTFPCFLYLRIIVWTDEHGTFRHLEIATKDEPHLWRSTILFLMSWLISLDFPMMSKKEALCFRCAFRYALTGVPPINSNGINLLIRRFLSSEWNHMEFSFCLKTH